MRPISASSRRGFGSVVVALAVLVLAGNHLVVLTEDGDVGLVNATPARHEEISRFPAIEGKTWNHPVIVGNKLLVRNGQEMACFELALEK